MSSVSCAMRFCFASGSDAIVRMLCSRSASLMSRTRTSFAIATSILRIVAACAASRESNCSRSSLVTPSTIAVTSAPNRSSRSASVTDVSSTASCSSAPASVTSSRPRSDRIIATPSGCAMYGSPERRTWSRCASRATSYACSTSATSARELRAFTEAINGRTAESAVGRLCRRTSAAGDLVIAHQRVDVVAVELVAAVQESELDDEREADHLTAQSFGKTDGRGRRAAGRDDVVDDQHLLTGRDRVAVDLEEIGAVLELVLLALDLTRQLSRLAHGHEPRHMAIRDGRREHETAGLDAEHLVDVLVGERGRDRIDGGRERIGRGQKRSDVAKDDPGLRIIRDVAHVRLEPMWVH